MQSFDIFFDVILNKMLNQQSSYSDLLCHDGHVTSM